MPANSLGTLDPETEIEFRQFRSNTGGFTVFVAPFALSQVEMQIRESVKAIRGHGVETGGLVLGRKIDRRRNHVVITGFLQVEIEYRFGPLFRPSESDLDAFKQAASLAGDKAIGYFRSQLRSGMLIRDEDIALLESVFPEGDCCFATIEATIDTPSVLSLHKVPAGQLPLLAVRFPVKEVAVPVTEDTPPIELQRDLEGDSHETSAPSFVSIQAKNWLGKPVFWILGVGAAILIAAASYEAGKYWPGTRAAPAAVVVQAPQQAAAPVPTAPRNSKIELHLADLKDGVEARWDPANPLLQNAARGFLIIFDSHEPKRIELDQARLRSGVYHYTPINKRVAFWITVYQPDGTFAGDTQELVRSTGAAAQPVQAAKNAAPPPSRAINRPAPSEKAPSKPLVSTPRVFSTDAVTISRQPAGEPVRSPVIPEPPPSRVVGMASPQAPAISAPALASPVLPAPAPPADPALNYKASVNRSVPARVIHQASPSVPIVLASKIRTEVQIEVGVQVDSTGKVTGVRVVSSQGPLAGLLAIEALKAAQLCRFSPAQEDGRPVSSSAKLTFRFAPRLN